MKIFTIACAVLLAMAATTAAGELAVSKSVLGDMGLGGMEKMSDEAGMTVRGKGSSVWGGSSATWGQPTSGKFSFTPTSNIAHSENYYEASGPNNAAGGSLSFAGAVQVEFWSDPTGYTLGVKAGIGLAGGGAFAVSM